MRVALILGLGDVLEVQYVVVAWVAIFVVHLPGIFTGRRAKKGKGNNSVEIEILSTHLCPQVARWVSRSKGYCTTQVANTTVRTDLPASRRSGGQGCELPNEGVSNSRRPPMAERHCTETHLASPSILRQMSTCLHLPSANDHLKEPGLMGVLQTC